MFVDDLKLEIDRQLINQLTEYITELSQKYNIYISLGELTGIRRKAQRGNGNKAHRIRIHRWPFARVSTMLEHKLSQIGLEKRFLSVSEVYTSKTCWKCNTRGVRPRQNLFVCKNTACGWKGNADLNGAINIAKNLIKEFMLTRTNMFGKKGIGKYMPVTSKRYSRKNGKAINIPKAVKGSPRRKTTGFGSKKSKDDQSASLETPTRVEGHTNRTQVQHSELIDLSIKRRRGVRMNEQVKNLI